MQIIDQFLLVPKIKMNHKKATFQNLKQKFNFFQIWYSISTTIAVWNFHEKNQAGNMRNLNDIKILTCQNIIKHF